MEAGLALENSLAWYASVLRAHGVPWVREADYAVAGGPVPPYYSALVTIGTAGTQAQLERIGAMSAAPPAPVWSLKDSHAALDPAALSRLGLRKLFDARWFGLAPGAGADSSETGARFERVADPDALARWEADWQQSSPAPGTRVFPATLLDDPDVTFLAAKIDGEAVGGAVANRSAGAVGLSNVFVLTEGIDAAFLRDCARAVDRLHPDQPVVGYGPASELGELAPLGAADLGGLRVWISEASTHG